MVDLAVAIIAADFAFVGKEPFDQLVADYPDMKGLLVDKDCFDLLPERNASKAGNQGRFALTLYLGFQAFQ